MDVRPLALLIPLCLACSSPSRAPAPPPPEPATASPIVEPPPPVDARPPALEGEWVQRVDDFYIGVPIGAREPREIVVGVHGAGDRADWSCSEWVATLEGRTWVVCPIGHPAQWKDTFSWWSAEHIAKKADAAVAALKAKYPAYVKDGPMFYAGWSQGATLASEVFRARPGVYDRVALVEIGHTSLDARAVASSLATNGAKHAIVACSTLKCRAFAADFARAAKSAKLPTDVVDAGLRGHWFDDPMFQAIRPVAVPLL